ncbi:helix-turn-helix transcriptional regulator [Asticcacaulis sp. DXS10W]|uniref:Helix-turn-helix transcriptional regulator n=1 Tax=Asticcacaulis currens TaxID=2984210 RepID=A0ABT5IBI3_9CAUL|nr:helix-turn-helix transcriptional regulator [Asticcacaulis currens]MDC7693524.1 helix-turn-helix transcriptional regulator [Asticcacaulis currens]
MDHDLYSAPQQKMRLLLKRARIRKGQTQKSLAAELGEHQSFISKYERGERTLNSTEWIEILLTLGGDPMKVSKIISEMF